MELDHATVGRAAREAETDAVYGRLLEALQRIDRLEGELVAVQEENGRLISESEAAKNDSKATDGQPPLAPPLEAVSDPLKPPSPAQSHAQ